MNLNQNKMEKTAVEFLEEQIVIRKNGIDNSIPLIEIFEQAKEIEKQQIINARQDIYTTGNLSAEQYYNETFKNK